MRIRYLLLGTVVLTAGAARAQSLPGVSEFEDPAAELFSPADVSVTLDDGLDTVKAGQVVTWTLVIKNVGINGLAGVLLTTALSRDLRQVSWNCIATMGSQCRASGFGAPNDSVVIASRGSVNYRITATVGSDASDTISVSSSATTPSGYIDLTPENNRATDIDVVVNEVIFTDGFDG
jgi:uncharacterized repeat protein (TIGR01451 family)